VEEHTGRLELHQRSYNFYAFFKTEHAFVTHLRTLSAYGEKGSPRLPPWHAARAPVDALSHGAAASQEYYSARSRVVTAISTAAANAVLPMRFVSIPWIIRTGTAAMGDDRFVQH
jgi:hypothetical protein